VPPTGAGIRLDGDGQRPGRQYVISVEPSVGPNRRNRRNGSYYSFKKTSLSFLLSLSFLSCQAEDAAARCWCGPSRRSERRDRLLPSIASVPSTERREGSDRPEVERRLPLLLNPRILRGLRQPLQRRAICR